MLLGGSAKNRISPAHHYPVHMASTSSISNALQKLLTCPVCLDRYTQPRILPCLHSFCHSCLNSFPRQVKRANRFITCPVCRQEIRVQQPDEGANRFKPAFLINNLLELDDVLEKISGAQQHSCDNCRIEQPTGYCKQCSVLLCQTCIDKHNEWVAFTNHEIMGVDDVAATVSKLVPLKEPTMECSSHGKPLEVYCDTCDELICHLCTVRHHRNHECDAINDVFSRHQQQIVDSLQQVKQKLATINDCVHALENQKGDFLKNVAIAKSDITATIQQLMQLLQESERELLRELDQISDAYVQKITARRKEAETSIAQLKTCENFAEEELRIGSQQEVLMMKGQMVERMEAVCSQINIDNLQPLEKTRVRFVKSTTVFEACHSLGRVVRYGQCKITRSKVETRRGEASFSLSSSIPISADLVSCKISMEGWRRYDCDVRKVSPVTFETDCYLSTAGPHNLKVQVGGSDIFDLPVVFGIKPKILKRFFTKLAFSAMAISNDNNLIVADCANHCISVFNITSKRKLRSFGRHGSGQLQFRYPRGLAVNMENHIVVADSVNHRLQVLTAKGAFIATVGSKGSGPLQFDQPWDVAVYLNKKIFITDTGNNRVQVLNAEDLSYLHCFGSKGTQPREFDDPRGLAIDIEGIVYVADCGNNRVQKFTLEGDLLAIIDSKGEEGRLNCPQGLCVSRHTLYVTERGSNTVSMFIEDGFIGYVGDSDGSSFKRPWSVVYSDKLYINDQNGVTVCVKIDK